MKLAIIGDELDQDLNRVVDAVLENEFEGIEVRSVWNTQPDKLSNEQLKKIHKVIKDKNLAVSGFDSACFKTLLPRSQKELEEARKSFQQAIEQARILNAGFVRIFAFYKEGYPDPLAAGKIIKEIIKDIVPDDIEIYIETGMRTNTPTIQHMLKCFDIIGDDRLGVVWDPGNSIFAGATISPFPSDYFSGRELIKHIHIKDPIGQKEYVRLGEGDVPWFNIIQQLKEDNYQGWLSLETHWRIGRILTQGERDNPWFDRFSLGGYEASIECMKKLKRYMEGLAQ